MPSAYVVTTTADSGTGSLRDAITQVNADTSHALYASPSNPSEDEIDFNITTASDTGGGYNTSTSVATLAPLSALPAINNAVLIDGYITQPGASQNTLTLKIELRGNSSIATGLELHGAGSNGSIIKGLAVNSFSSRQIELNASNNDSIQGNFIGLDATGTYSPVSLPDYSRFVINGAQGTGVNVEAGSQNNVIGTNGDGINDAGERNVISACRAGVNLSGASSNNVVAGNYIGTDASGTQGLGNYDGITASGDAKSNRIGTNWTDTDAAGESNLISGNVIGILFGSGGPGPAETGGMVAGNMIGPNVNGNQLTTGTFQGNRIAGIAVIESSSKITLGGSSAVLANTIAYNNGPGVTLPSFRNQYATAITVRRNAIYENSGPGIDLGGTYDTTSGLNPGHDDNSDPDGPNTMGPNHFQHSPSLNSVEAGSSITTISGSLSSNNAGPFILDFYANRTNPTPGQTYLGSATITATGSFLVVLPVVTPAGEDISATATDFAGDTSVFSNHKLTTSSGQTFSDYLKATLATNPPSEVVIQANTSTISTVVGALSPSNLGSSVTPVSVYLNLAPGMYSGQTVSVPTGMTLYIDGSHTNQLPTTIDPAMPALTVLSGNVVVSNVTFVTTGDAPTILVTGGNLTLRHDTIQESADGTDAAISITGGTVDLGTVTDPGGNTINVNGSGEFVQNTTANLVPAAGNTFASNDTVVPAPVLSFTALTSSVNPSVYGQAVTFTATVRANSSGSDTPSGSVDFVDTSTNTDLGSVTLSGGTASLTASALVAGNHVILARYSGDATFLLSQAAVTQTVNPAPLTVSTNSSLMLFGNSPPPLTGSVTGTPFTDTITYTTAFGDQVTITLSTTATSTSPLGQYAITATLSGASAGNYTIDPHYGTMYVVSLGADPTSTTGAQSVVFWDNKGNAKLITAADLSSLDVLNLVTQGGAAFDPKSVQQLQAWLSTSPNATTAYQLAVQLAAMDLNVLTGYVKLSDLIYAGQLLPYATADGIVGLTNGGFINVQNLISAANAVLSQVSPGTPSGDPNQAYEAALTQVLQAANGNTDFVSQEVCWNPTALDLAFIFGL